MSLTDQDYTAIANASGVATVDIFCKSRNRNWLVQQVSVKCATAGIGATCELQKNGVYVTTLIPTGDSAAGDPSILIRGVSDRLTVRWAGLTAGAACTVLAIYDEQAV